jgi:hypothetical protein
MVVVTLSFPRAVFDMATLRSPFLPRGSLIDTGRFRSADCGGLRGRWRKARGAPPQPLSAAVAEKVASAEGWKVTCRIDHYGFHRRIEAFNLCNSISLMPAIRTSAITQEVSFSWDDRKIRLPMQMYEQHIQASARACRRGADASSSMIEIMALHDLQLGNVLDLGRT